MTLIAVTSNFGYPIMLGDILTTAENPDQDQPIPTFQKSVNQRLPPEQKFLPFRLSRKIYVVTDQLAVGLAGSTYEMKEFLGELKNRFRYLDVTGPNILKFLQEFDKQVYPNISAVLLHANHLPQGIAIDYYYFGVWHVQETEAFGKVLACGSGSPTFLREAGQKWTMPVNSLANSLTWAISRNYGLLGNILGQERLSLSTIKKYWGAGFEMIYFDGERFHTMEDITIVLWQGRLDIVTGKFAVAPLTFLNYRYSSDGEVLVIDVADSTGCNAYGVLPLYLRPDEIDQAAMSTQHHFDARRICFSYILEVAPRMTVDSETTAHIASPTFYTEKSPDIEPAFLPKGTENPFRSTRSDGSIPNLGLTKVDVSPEGDIRILVQEGVHEQVIEGMRQVLLDQLDADGQLPPAPFID